MFQPARISRITRTHARHFHASARYSRHLNLGRLAKRSDFHFQVSPEVLDAIETNTPVVALETTIYTHGFPYPDNMALALHLESVVRKNGGVPATIGVIEGQARVGLTADEILAITEAAGKEATMKVSRRDLPYILGLGIAGRKLTGGTTVAGTMFLARRAGIRVFGTGGLGGVHRGGQDTMDISADLTELGRTCLAVVSSGCKSFLDIPRTLEYLETQGAGVFTFADGRSGEIDFPAFWTRDSGIRSPMVVQNEREAAAMIFAQEFFRNSSGLLLANPIPEEFSIPKEEINVAIEQAVQEAADKGFHGHKNTPFILARIKELTKGNSIPANRALIESNVARATKIAVEYEKIRVEQGASEANQTEKKSINITRSWSDDLSASKSSSAQAALQPAYTKGVDIIVAGSVAVDLSCDHTTQQEPSSSDADLAPRMHTSNRAQMRQSIGGVGHNVALAAHRAGSSLSVQLRSLVAQDAPGHSIIKTLEEEGLDTRGVRVLPAFGADSPSTAQYIAVNDGNKDLVLAMADMSIFTRIDHNKLKVMLSNHFSKVKLKWMVVDGNWTPAMIRYLASTASKANAKVAFEPVSTVKSTGLFEPSSEGTYPMPVFPENMVDLATPNQHELEAMHAAAKKHEWFNEEPWWTVIDALGIPSSGARNRFVALTNLQMTDAGIPLQTIQLLPFIPTILTKLGAEGVLLTELLAPSDPRLTDPESAPYILSRCDNGNPKIGGVYMRLFPAVEVVGDVVSVNGVGDTFLGVLIAGLARGLPLNEKLVDAAQRGAVMTLRSKEAVSPEVAVLSKELDELAEDAGISLSGTRMVMYSPLR